MLKELNLEQTHQTQSTESRAALNKKKGEKERDQGRRKGGVMEEKKES